MILAAHQPSYLPWLGYLDKMAKADVFVVMDDLQYEKDNFQNRNRVKLNNGAGWLTVPLDRGSQLDRICDKRIQNGGNPKEHWQRKTWVTLETHYGRAPPLSLARLRFWKFCASYCRSSITTNRSALAILSR